MPSLSTESWTVHIKTLSCTCGLIWGGQYVENDPSQRNRHIHRAFDLVWSRRSLIPTSFLSHEPKIWTRCSTWVEKKMIAHKTWREILPGTNSKLHCSYFFHCLFCCFFAMLKIENSTLPSVFLEMTDLCNWCSAMHEYTTIPKLTIARSR